MGESCDAGVLALIAKAASERVISSSSADSEPGKSLDFQPDVGLPPVNEWHPTLTREIDMRIAANGDWFYQGSPIKRDRMVKLFSTVLRIDEGETYLVTPQERLKIQVDDAPFTAVSLERHKVDDEQCLMFTTNVGDRVMADAQHPITVHYKSPGGEPSPYVLVRDKLQALISRPVFMQLAEYIEERDGILGVVSKRIFMPMSDPSLDAD